MPRMSPPGAADWLLRRILPGEDYRERSGDLEEVLRRQIGFRGRRRARLWYWGQVIKLVPAHILNSLAWRIIMFGNYLRIALRTLKKQRGYALLNIIGLAVGMTGCLMVGLYLKNELSFDRFHRNAARIHRIAAHMAMSGRETNVAVAAAPIAAALKDEMPEVENAVRFCENGSLVLKSAEKGFREHGIVYCDASLFEVFTIPLLAGDPDTALREPHSLVLSRATAEKYFGGSDPLGKTLTGEDGAAYQVTGLFDRIPDTSHFHFDIFASLSSLDKSRSTNWIEMSFQTYLLLREDADAVAVEAKFPAFLQKFIAPRLKDMMGKTLAELETEMGLKFDFYLQPLTRIHLHSDLLGEFEPNGDFKTVLIFAPIALFILIIAGINFMNLSTASSAGRAREVGLRKVMGSQRRDLIRQFLLESLLLSAVSLAVALLLVVLFMPAFNRLAGLAISPIELVEWPMPLVLAGIVAVIGLLAGSYPAFVLSAFQPVRVLQGRMQAGLKAGPLRSGLVVFQFTASIILIIGTLVVFRQLHYIRSKPVGFDREQVLVLENASLLGSSADSFKTEMLNHPNILSATLTGHLPVPSSRTAYPVIPEGESAVTQPLPIAVWSVDHDYIETLGMRLASGRNFSREHATDHQAAILNQSAVRHFGLEEALGRSLKTANDPHGESQNFTVIGVLEDFHYESLRDSIQPLMLVLDRSTGHLSFRIRSEGVPGTIAALREQWKRFLPFETFSYSFLDDKFDAMYRSDLRTGQIFGVFAGLAVLIGCLGLFGLAAFTAENRTKEIGIRKVLGASVSSILSLLMKEFLILIGIANLIAWPVGYYVMRGWLMDFAYRGPFALWILPAAGAAAALIALTSVGWQALRAAVADPVHTLRYE